ncbi:MAG TPA: glucose-1-phosphate adenylyltransferase [Candidatus Polarisedimenticolaceae bacterium]|nr:glucose-1-phosphate adenylyltransferase [Candidatus Polarisedimenticolaceae bacterium]
MGDRRRTLLGDILAIVMAGGQGERLYPLTRDRGKPAVPFGGIYRVIDFTLSNCLNSGLRKVYVLTQYKSGSLERHVRVGWGPRFNHELDEWIQCVPPQLRVGQRWYQGTADAVYQNIYLLEQERPRTVMVLSGDHVYKMDYSKMLAHHEGTGAVATVAAVEVPIEDASAFGVLAVDDASRITAFQEKPETPSPVPERPDTALVNMGVYVFDTESLVRALTADARRDSRHDFGHDILPSLVETNKLFVYRFVDENRKDTAYWRDIGTLDSYYEASMDLVAVEPVFNLYDKSWPIRSMVSQLPPAKTVFAQEEPGGRLGIILDSLVSGGVIVSGGRVERSILGPEVRVNSYARVVDSVLMDGVDVGRRARVARAIVDKGVRIPADFIVGEDAEEDKRRFTVTPGGVVVIPRETRLD